MKLKLLVAATSAALFSAGAFAAAADPQQRQQSQAGDRPMSQSQPGAQRDSQAQPGQRGQQTHSPEVVRKVQQELKDKGIDAGPVDGQWGPKTQAGLKKFQEQSNMKATGQLDQQTLSALGVDAPAAAGPGARPGGDPSGAGPGATPREKSSTPGAGAGAQKPGAAGGATKQERDATRQPGSSR